MRRAPWFGGWVLIAAVPLFTAIAACNQPAPASPGAVQTTANQAPVITTQPITPALGIDDVTTFSLRVDVRDLDGDAVSLQASGCSLGDETPVALDGGVATIAFQSSRNCGSTIVLAAMDVRGNTANVAVPFQHTRFENWYRLVIGDGFYDQPHFYVTLQQSGATITGTIRDSRNDTGVIDQQDPGTVDAEGRFRLRFKIQSEEDLEIAGQVISTGNNNLSNDVVVATGTVTSPRFAGRTFKLWREAQF